MKTITKTNFAKKIFIGTMALVGFTGFAQEEGILDKVSLSGSVDAYYRTNIGAPNDDEAIAPGTSFANLNGFAIGMANAILSYDGAKTGFVADLVFGPRGTDATFESPMYSLTGNVVNQLYAYWNVNESLTLTLGNFNTFLGYEVISPAGNFNYSTSYLFSYGPFSHTGLKADYAINDDWSVMLAVMNPTDLTEYNPTGNYSVGAQLGFYGQYLNFLYSEGGFELDFTGGFDVSEAFFLGLNAAYYKNGDEDLGFYGAAIYPQYSFSDSFALGFRGEYFGEIGDFGAIGTGVEDSSVFAATLSANYSIGGLTIIPELRLDSASDDAFMNADMDPTKSLSSFLVAAVYAF